MSESISPTLSPTFEVSENEELNEILARMERNGPTLIKLNLSGHGINNFYAIRIAIALIENATITSLNLSNNNIDQVGAVEIAGALRCNTTLKELDLSGNPIAESVVKQIALAIGDNKESSIKLLMAPGLGENIRDIVDKYKPSDSLGSTNSPASRNSQSSELSVESDLDFLALRSRLEQPSNSITRADSSRLEPALDKQFSLD